MTNLTPADGAFAETLASRLPKDALRAAEPRFLEEPRGRYAGQGGIVARPRSADQVAEIIRAANAARVGVIPYGGGTGLVGAQVMPEGPAPLILSLERMNRVRDTYPEENVLIAEAGANNGTLFNRPSNLNLRSVRPMTIQGSWALNGVMRCNVSWPVWAIVPVPMPLGTALVIFLRLPCTVIFQGQMH